MKETGVNEAKVENNKRVTECPSKQCFKVTLTKVWLLQFTDALLRFVPRLHLLIDH